MSTPNIILMIALSVMIGFAIGNVWGKETMKKLFSEILNKLTDGIKAAANQQGGKKED